jgi:cytochrome c556
MGKGLVSAFAMAIALTGAARAQDQSAATPSDVIFARKIMMDSIGKNMDEIEGMVDGGKFELTEGREHAEAISVMLMSFPHLFPAASNQWKDGATRDPGVDTYASPDVWKNFSEFYRLAQAASKTAFRAGRAKDQADLKKSSDELRAQCDACHAAFTKKD